jgi:hypothetical protein
MKFECPKRHYDDSSENNETCITDTAEFGSEAKLPGFTPEANVDEKFINPSMKYSHL